MTSNTTSKGVTNLQQLHDDIVKACKISDSPYNSDVIWRLLGTYSRPFSRFPTSFRTTTRDKRDVNVRYLGFGIPDAPDPFPMAIGSGLLKQEGHPVEKIIAELQARFSFAGYGGYGIDFGADYGLEKIWAFFDGAQMIEEVFQIPSLPPAVMAHADYFAQYDLNDPRVIGVDFRSKSLNLYYLASDINGNLQENIVGMIRDLGFCVPSKELLGYCRKSLPIYYTFTWDSPRVERLCFCTAIKKEEAPVHLHPVIKRYVNGAPVLDPQNPFLINVTMVHSGEDYLKIENDYTGTGVLAIGNYVRAPAARSVKAA